MDDVQILAAVENWSQNDDVFTSQELEAATTPDNPSSQVNCSSPTRELVAAPNDMNTNFAGGSLQELGMLTYHHNLDIQPHSQGVPYPSVTVSISSSADSDSDYVPPSDSEQEGESTRSQEEEAADINNRNLSLEINDCVAPPSKKSKKGRQQDAIWIHFKNTGNGRQQECEYCNYKINFPQPDRLRKHLLKCPKSKQRRTVVPLPEESVRESTSHCLMEVNQPVLSAATKQATLKSFFINTSKNQKSEFDSKLMKFICGANVPISTVDNKEFRNFVAALRPSYTMPSSKVVGGELLNKTFQVAVAGVVQKIKNSKAVMMQDGWQSPQSEAVIAHSLQVDQKCYLLNCEAAGINKKTSEFLFERFEVAKMKAEEEYKVTIIGCVTDNCNVMKKLRRLILSKYPDLYVYGCNSHYWNLVGRDFTPDIVDDIISVQKYFKNKDIPAAALKASGGTRPKIPCDTRWNSQLETFRSFRNNQSKYLELLNDTIITSDMPDSIKQTILDGAVFEKVNQALTILEPIAFSLDICQRDSSTVADAVSGWLQTKDKIGDLALDKRFFKRYNLAMLDSSIVAYMLHPKFRGARLSADERERGREWLREKGPGFSLISIAFHGEDVGYFSKSLFRVEVVDNISPLTWWATAHRDNPDKISDTFLDLIDHLMRLPSSSAGIERCFSSMTNTITDKRNRLSLEKATKIAMVNRHL